MKKSLVCLFFLLPVFMWTANARPRHDMSSKYLSYKGLVMSDLSGLDPERDDYSPVIEDWKYLVDGMKLTSR